MSALDALQDCLAAEHAACYGYGVLGGALAGIPDRRRPRRGRRLVRRAPLTAATS